MATVIVATTATLARGERVQEPCAQVRAAVGERTPPGRLVTAPLPAGVVADVGLADLIAFYDNPARGFLRDRLQVGVSREADEVSDRLPVELDALEKWAVGDRALRARCTAAGAAVAGPSTVS